MNGKHLVILAAVSLTWSVLPVHAADGTGRLVATTAAAADTAGDGASKLQAGPTDVSAAKKKKGKGGKKGGEQQQYMTIQMEDAFISSYRPAQGGRPKGPSGGLLGTSGGNFSPNPPSPTGTPMAPPASRGASGPVIR